MAKKKDARETLHDLSAAELETRLSEIQEKNFRLRFRHASNPLKNPMELRHGRRAIAQIKTILNQKSRGAA